MKYLFLIFFLLYSSLTFAAEKLLFDCIHTKENSNVWGLKIMQMTKGRRTSYRLDVEYIKDGNFQMTSKVVPLNESYGGRILTYGTGNVRVKIDRAMPLAFEKFKGFARLPDFDIHSHDWICKGEMFRKDSY